MGAGAGLDMEPGLESEPQNEPEKEPLDIAKAPTCCFITLSNLPPV